MIGDHTVTVLAQGATEPVDVTCLVDEVSINHGREDTDSQPEPASATIDLATDTDTETWPTALEIGSTITVTTTVATTAVVRFLGKVTDLDLGWDDLGPDTPDHLVTRVIAVSTLADLGRRIVGDTPWPQELDGARVANIMAAAGVVLDPGFSDPGTVQVLARDVDSQPALAIAQEVAESASGLVWHTRAGEVRYADANHRRGTAVALELDACDLLVSPTWHRSTEGLINRVSLGYGVTPEAGEQPRYVADRPESAARYGRYEFTTETLLAALADATALGQLLLTRNSAPVWLFTDLPVAVKDLSDADTLALLGLELGALVRVTGMPAAGTAPTSAVLWVEGWSERLAWAEHEVTLTVSGYCRTVPPPRWNDVPPDVTWDTVTPATLTWDDAACWGPPVNLGRWDDQPASLRWDQVPATQTWDTYTPA